MSSSDNETRYRCWQTLVFYAPIKSTEASLFLLLYLAHSTDFTKYFTIDELINKVFEYLLDPKLFSDICWTIEHLRWLARFKSMIYCRTST